MHKIYEQKNLPYLNVQVCPHCKQLVALNLKVCPRCGHPIVEDKKEESVDEFPTQTVEMTTSNLKTPENQVDEIDASLDTTNLKNDKDVEKKRKRTFIIFKTIF